MKFRLYLVRLLEHDEFVLKITFLVPKGTVEFLSPHAQPYHGPEPYSCHDLRICSGAIMSRASKTIRGPAAAVYA